MFIFQELPTENTTAEDPAVENKVQDFIDRCQFTLTAQEALCDGDDISCLNNTTPLGILYCYFNK